ncbi:helix-turn-helix domain-containing protein [Kitasatospora cystarginea]
MGTPAVSDDCRQGTHVPGQFGETLRRHRLRAGLTQEELAERSGESAHAISVLEAGRRSPRLSSVSRLAAGLDLEPADRGTPALGAATHPTGLSRQACSTPAPTPPNTAASPPRKGPAPAGSRSRPPEGMRFRSGARRRAPHSKGARPVWASAAEEAPPRP